jgi:hypothetical protein
MKGILACPCDCGMEFKQHFRMLLLEIERHCINSGMKELSITKGPICTKQFQRLSGITDPSFLSGVAAEFSYLDGYGLDTIIRSCVFSGASLLSISPSTKTVKVESFQSSVTPDYCAVRVEK